MRNFLQRVCVVILSVIIIFFMLNAVYYKMSKNGRLTAFEVYDAIDISSQQSDCTALVLGDSVARQIFSPDYQEENKEVCYLTTNQAIMPAGNYILLENYLQNHPQTKKVYYIARPDSLQNGINFVYTYSYFVTPLYREPFLKYLHEETREGIEKMFGSFFSKREFAKWMLGKYPKLLEIYNKSLEKIWKIKSNYQANDKPDMAVSYILEMQKSCQDKKIEFILLSPPVPEGYDRGAVEEMREKMSALGMEDLIEEYADSIYYINQEEFVDGVHMRKEYLERNREGMLERMLR
ncbi:MAG: hypothetical protein NC400_09825 [Clostridium sp.]|nr:hypothetical protein [Clostridium sp.]